MNKNIIYIILLAILSLNVNATQRYDENQKVGSYTNMSSGGTNGTHNNSGNGDTSSDIERGKWYQFTKDFFSNCVSEITEVKKQSIDKETSGSSVSSVNARGSVKTMSSCITNNYNPLQPQVDRTKITQKGCKSEIKNMGICSFSLVPAMHNQNQKVAVNENSFSGVAEFSCVNGDWQQISASSNCVSKEVNKCPEINYSWGACSGITKESKNDTIFKLNSDNGKKGYVYVKCQNGTWQISANHISYCDSSACPLTGKVSWYDQNIIDIIKNEDVTNATGSIPNSNSLNLPEEELSLINELPYENNLAYQKLPKCIGDIKSTDGITGYSEIKEDDKTYFNNITEATQKGNFLKGKSDFKCVEGKWIYEGSPICKRETNISGLNCTPKIVRVVNGIKEEMYQCKLN